MKVTNELSVALLSLGCKVNKYETESIEEMFKKVGYKIKNFSEKADIYIINTCTVTNIADRKSRQMLHRAKKLNPEAIVVAVGCYVQSPQSKLEEDDLVDILVGTRGKSSVLKLVEDYINSNRTLDLKHSVIKEGKENKKWAYDTEGVYVSKENTRANIKIQDGCNQFCTYCIIPFVRGRNRSRDEESIVKEAQELINGGVKEIVLTGIHIGSYGLERDGKSHLLELLKMLNEIEGDFRIRLGSIEPRLITEEFLRESVNLKKVCPHFHLSLQSGSTTVLKRMNRYYTAEEYLNSVELLKKYYDRPGITTDIIIGFPGETEEEFMETVEFVKKVGFLKVHLFPYSMRAGTYAARLEQVSSEVKREREKFLMKVCDDVSKKYLRTFENGSERVLFEEVVRDREDYIIGHTDRFIEVLVLRPLLSDLKENYNKEFFEACNLTYAETSDDKLKQKLLAREIRKKVKEIEK